jgi:hypothetical protein
VADSPTCVILPPVHKMVGLRINQFISEPHSVLATTETFFTNLWWAIISTRWRLQWYALLSSVVTGIMFNDFGNLSIFAATLTNLTLKSFGQSDSFHPWLNCIESAPRRESVQLKEQLEADSIHCVSHCLPYQCSPHQLKKGHPAPLSRRKGCQPL